MSAKRCNAAFREVRRWLALGVIAGFTLGGPLRVQAAEDYPATDGQSIIVIGGVKRIEAAAFLKRYGLDVTWPEPGRRAVFSSAWTKLEIEADKREVTLNGLRLFLGDAVAVHGGKLYLSRVDIEALIGPILRSATYTSTRREPRTIVIDAGHGGKDGGTRNAKLKLNEKVMALDVAQRLAALLDREGYKVIMSRSDDTFVDLEERAIRANKVKADLFISIHFNAVVEGSPVKGTETYIMTPQYQRSTSSGETDAGDRVRYPGNASDAWNAVLGYQIHRQLLDELQTVDRGLKRARFVVLKLIDCPAVLVEAGYVSNDAEARKISTPAYRQKIAEALATGVARYAAQVRAAAAP